MSERRGAYELELAAGIRVEKREESGVQREAGRRVGGRGLGAVKDIAEDGVADAGRAWMWAVQAAGAGVCAVDAELVRAPGDGCKFEACAISFERQGAPTRGGGAVVFEVDELVGAIGEVGTDGEVDDPRFEANGTLDEGGVVLADDAVFELEGEGTLGVGVETEDDEAGGVHVEAVDHERASGAAEHDADAGRDAVLIFFALTWHREKARGLIDHHEPLSGMNDGKHRTVSGRGGGCHLL